jgi:hypothetical protein
VKPGEAGAFAPSQSQSSASVGGGRFAAVAMSMSPPDSSLLLARTEKGPHREAGATGRGHSDRRSRRIGGNRGRQSLAALAPRLPYMVRPMKRFNLGCHNAEKRNEDSRSPAALRLPGVLFEVGCEGETITLAPLNAAARMCVPSGSGTHPDSRMVLRARLVAWRQRFDRRR